MLVSNILGSTPSEVVTATPDQALADTAKSLADNPVGLAVVFAEDGELVGVISERDIVRAISVHGEKAFDLKVSTVMTRTVITCTGNDPIGDVARTMTDKGIRNLPVIDDNGLSGIISMSDLVGWRVG
jgi:CBS domain-containing protein